MQSVALHCTVQEYAVRHGDAADGGVRGRERGIAESRRESFHYLNYLNHFVARIDAI